MPLHLATFLFFAYLLRCSINLLWLHSRRCLVFRLSFSTRCSETEHILDLHGNTRKRERGQDGAPEENVFDIQQGVSIGIFVRHLNHSANAWARVYHRHLWGTRDRKYEWLSSSTLDRSAWSTIVPVGPAYLFSPLVQDLWSEYGQSWSVQNAVRLNSVGIVTARDALTIQWSREDVQHVISDFIQRPIEDARHYYNLGPDVRDWKVHLAQSDVRASGPKPQNIIPILYRPFEKRFTYYTGQTRGFICMPRPEVMRHMFTNHNLGMITARGIEVDRLWDQVLVTRSLIGHHTLSIKEVNYLLPLYIYPNQEELLDASPWPLGDKGRRPNLDTEFVRDIENRLGLFFTSEGCGDLLESFGPEDVFHYAYAILNSPGYRVRYAEFLKSDFPRLPLTRNLDLFRAMCMLGADLVALHLLEDTYEAATWSLSEGICPLLQPIASFPVSGSNLVQGVGKNSYQDGQLYINNSQYFHGIPPEVYEFQIGGYQVCQKWLKDRKGRVLSEEDMLHYCRVVTALAETIRLMERIDAVIEENGGWPIQ